MLYSVSESPSGIFVYHDGGLGDTLLSLSVFEVLKKKSSFIHIAGRADVVRLLQECGIADEVSDAGSLLYTPLISGSPDARLAGHLRRFSSAFLFSVRPRPDMAVGLSNYISEVRTILTVPSMDFRKSAAHFRLEQLPYGDLQISGNGLCVSAEAQEQSLMKLGLQQHVLRHPLVAVHPGSGGRKNWPLERFFEIARQLTDRFAARLVFLAGPAEGDEMQEKIRQFCRANGIQFIEHSDLNVIAAIVARADLYIGNDSGISHLAAAAGTPAIVVFGPTDPVVWAPPYRHAVVMTNGAACSPCGEMAKTCMDQHCLSALSAEEIMHEAAELLGRRGSSNHRP